MRIALFRNGRSAAVWTDDCPFDKTAAEVIQGIRAGVMGFEFEGLAQGAKAAERTYIFVQDHSLNPPRGGVTHTHQHRECSEPDTVFVAVIASEEMYRLKRVAAANYRRRQRELKALAMETRKQRKKVRWTSLTPKQKDRFARESYKDWECWIWRPLPALAGENPQQVSPYKKFYVQLLGAVPTGIFLNHKCGDRLCMNPNHLYPGTPKENVRDTIKARRHSKMKKRKRRVAERKAQ